MAEEAPGRGAEEGEWVNVGTTETWWNFAPQVGDVVEFTTALVAGGDGTISAAMIVLEKEMHPHGGLVLHGRFIQSGTP